MAVKKRGSTWQADLTVKGKRHRHSFATKDEANDWYDEATEARNKGLSIPEPKTLIGKGGSRIKTIEEIFETVARLRWESCKSGSKLIMNGRLFVEFIGPNIEASTIDYNKIMSYVDHCRHKCGNSFPTVNRKLSSVRVMLEEYAERDDKYNVPKIPRYKENTGALNFFNKNEEDPVLTELMRRSLDNLYDLYVFLLDTGCRINEALKLDFSHVQWSTPDYPKGTVTFMERKSGHFSAVPLTRRARLALERRLSSNGPEVKPFGDIKYQWARDTIKDVYSTLGGRYVDNISQPFHILRHTCASRLAMANVNATRIKEWMDHSSLLVTQRYMKLTPSNLKTALDALEQDAGPDLRVVNNDNSD